MLTRSSIGKKCSATFYHSIVGCPITPDELHFVEKSGTGKGTGVELDPISIFTTTATKFIPSTVDLTKVTKASDMNDVKAPRSGQKKR